MKKSTSILRGLNDIRASYILESEIPDAAPAASDLSDENSARGVWRRITSSGWFAAAVCAIVAGGVLTCIILAGQNGPGTVTPPVGTLPEGTAAETTEAVTEDVKAQRGLMKQTVYDADGNETHRTQYTYENGRLVKERFYLNGRGTDMKVYTYNENGLVIQEKYTFYEVPSAGWTTIYEYDGEGRIILRQDIYANNKPMDEKRTEYDELGRILREESKDAVTTYTYGENGSYTILKEYKNEPTETRMETITDERGNVIRERSYRNEELTDDYAYEYNENGQKIKAYLYSTDGSESISQVTVYDYDDSGNIVRITMNLVHEKITSVHSYEYNEHGEKTRELRYTYMDSELESFSTVVYEYGIIP